MFDSFPAPGASLNEGVPLDWPVRLKVAAAPTPSDRYTVRRREALVAMADGSWEEAVVWAWAWNVEGEPVRWRCQVEVGGHVRWYAFDEAWIRTSDAC